MCNVWSKQTAYVDMRQGTAASLGIYKEELWSALGYPEFGSALDYRETLGQPKATVNLGQP